MESETQSALLEGIENLEGAHGRIRIQMSVFEKDSNYYDNLDKARALVADTIGLLRSILDKGR